ncbi:putative bifunctional diguanylate cyclase/phosphodiesterase [Actinoplanes philippinensis]|uniref:putative bifunctional diguanylate cyclase/phosphodiesterase n=1 Tax=Actinoplanes philippinensis TaxID=35752 RepID=UPI0033C87B74
MGTSTAAIARRMPGPAGICAVLALVALVATVVDLERLRTPTVLLWIALPVSALIALASLVAIARRDDLTPVARRFWRHTAIGTAFAAVGATVNTYDCVVGGAAAADVSVVAGIGYAGAIVGNLWAMARLPLKVAGRGSMLRVGLDGLVVLLATGSYSWHFVTRPVVQEAGFTPAALVSGTVFLALNLLALMAFGKVALAGRSHLAPGVLPMMALGMASGMVSSLLLQKYAVDRPWLAASQVSVPVAMLCAVLAGRAQLRAVASGAGPSRAARRMPVWLPYLSIVAVYALLVHMVAVGDSDALLFVVLAGVLTALVATRQQTVFRENANLVARLDHGATHDTLTGLPNRALFTDRLDEALAASHTERPVSVALIDLDDFKAVNDTLGHGVGDALLIAVADRLAAAVRKEDTVARLGGDEFVVVLDGMDPDNASTAAGRLIAALAEPVVAGDHELLVRASIGVAGGHSGENAADLLRRADIAMYAAKHHGGSNVEQYTEGMAASIADSAAIGAQLQHAINEGQMFLEYQPIVTLDGGRLRGVEALVRWNHPARGIVPPIEFIPVAERTGLIVPLGDWVLLEACRQLAAWRDELGDRGPGIVNVNVSARQLRDPGYVGRVAATLAETGLPPHRLTLEITESTAVALGESVGALDDLRRMGIRIALDDFGTGQSTLTLLHELPVDQLKLDRSFTQGTDTGRRDTMPSAVIALAEAVGLDLVAEGVENRDQADRLAVLGYQYAQGYHFARPLSPDAVTAMVAALPKPSSGETGAADLTAALV